MVGPLAGGGPGTPGDPARFGVLTVSDRASGGVYEDLSGPAILGFFADAVASPWVAEYACVPDERAQIEAAIIDLVRAGPSLRRPRSAAGPGGRGGASNPAAAVGRRAPSARPPRARARRSTPAAAASWSPPAAPAPRRAT